MSRKSLVSRASNRILHLLARSSPGATTLRPFLHRLRGVTIRERVFISDEVYIDNEYPECVEIHENVQIGIRTIILAHTRGPGRVVIEKFAYIGPNCVILGPPGRILTVGEGSVVAAGSVVKRLADAWVDEANPTVNHGTTTPLPLDAAPKVKAGYLSFNVSGLVFPVAKVTLPLPLADNYEEFITGLVPVRHPVARVANDTK